MASRIVSALKLEGTAKAAVTLRRVVSAEGNSTESIGPAYEAEISATVAAKIRVHLQSLPDIAASALKAVNDTHEQFERQNSALRHLTRVGSLSEVHQFVSTLVAPGGVLEGLGITFPGEKTFELNISVSLPLRLGAGPTKKKVCNRAGTRDVYPLHRHPNRTRHRRPPSLRRGRTRRQQCFACRWPSYSQQASCHVSA